MSVIQLLEYLQEIIETGGRIPMTGRVMVDKKEALDTIEQIINSLPEEFKKAQWIMGEKERILSEAVKDAEIMKKENVDMLKKQVESHSITKEAQLRADQIISSAQKDAKDMRLAARDYVNEILNELDSAVNKKYADMMMSLKNDYKTFMNSLQDNVNSTSATVRDNIKELKDMK